MTEPTDTAIDTLILEHGVMGQAWPTQRQLHAFARAIEADVRAQDEALIRQLVEALEQSHATLWEEDDDPARPVHEAIVAGRARLEGTP